MRYSLDQIYEPNKVDIGNTTYSTKAEGEIKTVGVKVLGQTLHNKTIELNFNKDSSYYFNFKIKTDKTCDINIKLVNGKDSQFIKKITSIAETEQEYFICVTSKNEFTNLEFEIVRTGIDDITTTLTIGGQDKNITIYKVINIIDNTYRRIGLQAEPGSIFIINNEEVRMGKTGMFEFKNDNIPIYSFSCIKAEKGFIFDGIKMEKEASNG